MKKFITKNYMYLNIVFLSLSIYIILFPIILALLEAISPISIVCPYLRLTGNPCPLCGGTRYIANIFEILKNPSYLISPFGLIVLFVLFEIIFRIYLLIKRKYSNKLILFDIIYHSILFILFVAYEILFFVIY